MANSLGDAALVFLLGTGACLALGRVAVPCLKTHGAIPARYEDCPPLQAYQRTKTKVPTITPRMTPPRT